MSRALRVLQPFLSVILGLTLGLLVTLIAGESPWHVLKILAHSAFGSPYDIGMTIFYATPLIFTGLSVAIAFQCGLFNIGAEGQLVLGALAAAVVGIVLPNLPWPLAPIAAGTAAFGMGAFWGAIPGWLRARRGSHEVINTIMLNFVAAGLASYATLYLFRNHESWNPETADVGAGYLIAKLPFLGGAPVNSSLFLALAAAAAYWFFMWRTPPGFEIRAVGQSELAARTAGVDPGRARILAMALAGGVAGLVGVFEVLGNAGRFKVGFSPDYGFIGIAVALLGRGHPLGVVASALLFGALHKGTADLDLDTENVTKDLSLILQALVILCVSADGLWDWTRRRKS
jgi:general nucleoside transport system permease protein